MNAWISPANLQAHNEYGYTDDSCVTTRPFFEDLPTAYILLVARPNNTTKTNAAQLAFSYVVTDLWLFAYIL